MVVAQNTSTKGKKAVLEEWGNPKEMDPETLEDFEYEYDIPNMLMHDSMTASMNLMKLYGPKLEAILMEKLGGYFFIHAQNPIVEDEIHYSTLFYAELFNYCSDGVIKQGFKKVMEIVFPSVSQSDDVNYSQTASYLFGVNFSNFLTFLDYCSSNQ